MKCNLGTKSQDALGIRFSVSFAAQEQKTFACGVLIPQNAPMKQSAGRKSAVKQFAAPQPGMPPVITGTTVKRRMGNPNWHVGMQNPNPGGKPKELKEIQSLIRARSPEIIQKMIHLALNAKSQAVQAQCSSILLDRAYGKPLQTVQAQVSIIDQLPLEQQTKLAQALEALAAGKLIEGVAFEVKDDAK